MKKINFLLCSLIVSLCLVSCGGGNAVNTADFKGQTLNILCWEGYADPAFTKAFEEKYGVTVRGTYFGTSDELISKLQHGGGANYDIISPSSDVAGILVTEGFVEAIDVKKISQWDSLAPQIVNLKDVVKDGKVYGMPFTWGPDYLIYNTEMVDEVPTSWQIFNDKKYKGKVALWDDINSIYMAGQMLGYDQKDQSALYNMTDEQLAQAKELLIKMKPQVRKLWLSAGELDNLFKNKEIALAVGWPLTVANLNKQGMKLKAVIPQEGATGWIDRLMITKDSKNKDLALLYLDYISQPESMAKVLAVTNYNVANMNSERYLTPELKEINAASQYFDKLNFWQIVPNRNRYNEVWNEVKASK